MKSNQDIEFPDNLCRAIAEITDNFSFAYIQEAFVAALLAIAGRSKTKPAKAGCEAAWVLVEDSQSSEETHDEDDLDRLELWIEIRKQVKILREGMEDKATK